MYSLKAALTMPHLLLQKSKRKPKRRDNVLCLERRLSLWDEGKIDELLTEGCCIQSRLKQQTISYRCKDNGRAFANLNFQGKLKEALRMLSPDHRGGLLQPDSKLNSDRTVYDELIRKLE